MGSLLHRAWKHPEALQVVASAKVVAYIAEVLKYALQVGGRDYMETLAARGDIHNLQESECLYYLYDITVTSVHSVSTFW